MNVQRFINSISAADLNGDGKLDVLISHRSGSTTNETLLFGDGNGQLAFVRTILTGGEPGANVAGDFNQDDKIDFAVTVSETNRVLVYFGDNAGNFGAPVEYVVGTTPRLEWQTLMVTAGPIWWLRTPRRGSFRCCSEDRPADSNNLMECPSNRPFLRPRFRQATSITMERLTFLST